MHSSKKRKLTHVAIGMLLASPLAASFSSYASTGGDVGATSQTEQVSHIIVDAGTRLTVRMDESIDTRNNRAGHTFTATLEANLVSGNQIIARRGDKAYGQVTDVNSAGRVAGKAGMSVELTRLLIDGNMVDMVTHPLSAEGNNTASTTAGRTARTTAIGGLINGGDGARTGAKVGLGASLLTRGDDIALNQGTLLDFHLRAPMIVYQ